MILHVDYEHGMKRSLADLLLIAVVSEAYEGELVAHKGLWYGEGLLLPPILLDVIEVTRVNVTAQLGHDWSSRYTGHKTMDDLMMIQDKHGRTTYSKSLCVKGTVCDTTKM